MALFLGYWSIGRMPGDTTANGRFSHRPHHGDGRFHPNANTFTDYIIGHHLSHPYHESYTDYDYYHAYAFGHSYSLATHKHSHPHAQVICHN
jgi:hypothetical protein